MRRPPDKGIEPLLVRPRVRRKRRPGLERFVRGVKRVCLFAAAVVVVAYVAAAALRPLLLDREERAEVRRLSAAVAAAEAQNKVLRRRIKTLRTPKGIEVEARGLGWVRPGEILIQTSETPGPPLVPPKLGGGKGGPGTPPLGAVGPRVGLLHRFLDWLSETLGCREVAGRPRPPSPPGPLSRPTGEGEGGEGGSGGPSTPPQPPAPSSTP